MLLPIVILFGNNLQSQVIISSLKLHSSADWLSYSFPLVHTKEKVVADRINKHLQSTILNNDSISADTNVVFSNSKYIRYINEDSTGQSGYTSIAYTAELNNSKILSLSFNIETMGAYPENHQEYFNFFSATGNIITTKDLFTPEGMDEIKKLLLKEREKRIAEWTNEIDAEKDDSVWIREIFADCNKDAELKDFIIKKGQLVFSKEYCFPHFARPFDTDLDVSFSYTELAKFLSRKGKRLLQL